MTTSAWAATMLGEVVDLQRGFDLPEPQRKPGPYAVLGSGGPVGWHDQGPVEGPGLVIGRAANLGRPTWWTHNFWPLNTTLFVRSFRGNEPRFVFYLFESMDLSGYDSGSVQPMLNRNYVAGVPVRLPPLEEQRAIADILGALDDKIESNRRVVERTRDLARLGLQHAAEGANLVRVGDIADVRKGLSYKGSGLTDDASALPMVNLANFGRDGWMAREAIKYYTGDFLPRHLVGPGDLLIANTDLTQQRQILGRGLLVPEDMRRALFTHHVYAVTPRDPVLGIALWAAFDTPAFRERAEGFATGTTVAGLPREAVLDFEWPMPPPQTIGTARELLRRAWAAEVESRTVVALRDALLPELLSGRLRVPDARERVEAGT